MKQYDVLFLDFLLFEEHRHFCNSLVNSLIAAGASCFAVTKEDYLDFVEDENHVKVYFREEHIPGKNPIDSRLRLLKNMRRSLDLCKGICAKKTILLGYDPLTYMLIHRRLGNMSKVFLVQHHQLDEIASSKIKRLCFNYYKKDVNHILVDKAIVQNVQETFVVTEDQCFVFPIPLAEDTSILEEKGNYVLGISNSNDEAFLDALEEMDKAVPLAERTGYRFILRTKKERKSTNSIQYIKNRIAYEEYLKLYSEAGAILMPFPPTYVYRCSGTLVDAVSKGKMVICSEIPLTKYYAKEYPSLCRVYSDVYDFLSVLEGISDTVDSLELYNFRKDHDSSYLIVCAEHILE